MTDKTDVQASEAADATEGPKEAPAANTNAANAGGGRVSGAMSPRISGDAGGEAQTAAEQALGSGKRIDLLRYLRLRRREK